MDKKMKRNLMISAIILVVFLVGVIALVHYGGQASKNSSNININQVAGVNNVTLSKTDFTATNISNNSTMIGISEDSKGYDKYHDKSKNVLVYHIPSKTKVEMLSLIHTSDFFDKVKTNLTELNIANITGGTTNTTETTGIKKGNVEFYNTFYFTLDNKTYSIRYQNKTALESFLEGWIKAYNAK